MNQDSKTIKKMELKPGFDYKILNQENRQYIQETTRDLKERLQRTAQDIWEIGQKLADVQSRLDHGQFGSWLEAEFGWSRRTAYNFIRVYKAFQENAKFAQTNIAPSALYLLASPSTPQSIRDQFIQQAKTGTKVTHKDILKAVSKQKFKPTSDETAERQKEQVTKLTVDAQSPEADFEVEYTVTAVEQPDYTANSTTVNIQYSPASWYLLEKQHLLFCGDTNSQEFISRLPPAAIALGVSAGEWRSNWLTKKASATIILDQQKIFDDQLIEELIKRLSKRKEAVILPWFPSGRIIALIHRLDRVLYTGDYSLERCKQAIAKSGLKAEKVNLP